MKKVILCILDGFGKAPESKYNAIFHAETPYLDFLLNAYPNSELQTSGKAVGLPDGQMGNSEVGHMTIGSGRVILQDLPRIDDAIETGELAKNKKVQELIAYHKDKGHTCHLLGLLSDGGVHSHQNHIIYMAKLLAQSGVKVEVHAFLDGRDTSPQSAISYIENFYKEIDGLENISLATVMGRFYGMDRDKRWDRTEKAYNAIVNAEGSKTSNFIKSVNNSYINGIFDEFVIPLINEHYHGIDDNDSIMMMNFRADRVRQIFGSLVDENFTGFARSKIIKFANKIGFMNYSEKLSKIVSTIFDKVEINNTLPVIIANNNIKQLRIAETEKYAHVTFFFNGGIEEPLPNEHRILIQSPKVNTYDTIPEMSAYELTNSMIDFIEEKSPGLVVVNYANCDMVGHSGNFNASVEAVETLDRCLSQLVPIALQNDYVVLITADHGNVETMEVNGVPFTSHTMNPVPLILVSNDSEIKEVNLQNGTLGDIAPTILKIMGIQQPKEMTGKSLI